MMVRPFQAQDAAKLGQVFFRSVHEVGSVRYTSAQLAVWAPAEPTEAFYLDRAGDGRVVLVAVDDRGRPLGYGDLKPNGHINHLYFAPEATRTGLAIKLYDQLEQVAVVQGIPLLYTEASELARSFFHKRGFATVERRDFLLRDVPIHNYGMEKRLVSRLLGAA
jgi:putative acetyltransferase